MNEEIRQITNERRTAKNEWQSDYFLRALYKMMTLYDFLRALFSVYQKLGQFFYHTYLLTCSWKDTSVLFKGTVK